ncbi:MAG: FecR family protein [Mangrovibacterium sp.]
MDPRLSLLKRFFQNRYSRKDYLELKKLLLTPDDEWRDLMTQHWKEFSPEAGQYKDLTEIFNAINRKLGKRSPRLPFRKLARGWSRVAAILLLPLLLLTTFLYVQFREYLSQQDVYVEVASPAGSRITLHLPDGSTVWLNGNSQISYPAVFSEDRQVKISGEAFFKVSSDKDHPFVVQADDLFIRATGTEFNVLAYPDESVMSVILKEGKVSVLDAGQTVLQDMEAGYRYDREIDEGKYAKTDAESYGDWINGKLVFENAAMDEVAKRLEHWYGVSIGIRDSSLLNLHFKATFINESIEEALKLLQSTATFNYRFINREIRADGTSEAAKIIISSGS